MQAIKQQIASEYYENGLKITVLQGFSEIIPRNSRLTPDKPRYSTQFAVDSFNQKLRQWCDVRKGRMQDLAKHAVVSESWFSKRRYGSRNLKEYDYINIVQPAMFRTEQWEKQIGVMHEIH